MPKVTAQQVARRKNARRMKKLAIWAGVAVVVGGIGYGIANSTNVRFDENALSVVDFSALNPDQKKTALVAANAARCTCGCGLALAQCIVTDPGCPLREGNIGRVQKMVADAGK